MAACGSIARGLVEKKRPSGNGSRMQHSGPSPLTLVIASVSSAAAAIVVRELWAPGTIASAAFTPLLVALFAEVLHRPSQRLIHVARQRLHPDRNAERSYVARLLRRPARWERVVRTTIAAFVIGSVALTGWELLLHHSLASGADQTTLWGGSVRRPPQPSTSSPRRTDASPAAPAPASRQTGTVTVAKPTLRTHSQPKRAAGSSTTATTTPGSPSSTTSTATTTTPLPPP